MLLKAFQLLNYKSFADSGKCSVQDGVTILAGQNESGKTNILSALMKLNDKEPAFAPDEYSFDQTDNPPCIKYWFELNASEIDQLSEAVPGASFSPEVIVEVQNKTRVVFFQHQYDGELSEEERNKVVVPRLEAMLPKLVMYQTLINDIPDTFTAQDIAKLPLKRLSAYLGADFSKIFSNKNQQQQRNATQKLSRSLSEDFSAKYKQKEVRLEFDINATVMSLYVRDKKPQQDDYGYSFQLSQRSTGLRWYLNFYIALKGEELRPGDVILVDEPGMYLHPKAQQEMRCILNEESKENQIIYTTHSPYLIDVDNLGQIRLVEKYGIDGADGYNEISVIRERVHHSNNIDTLKPIIDAIGYSLGSELNVIHNRVLICEGVSDYYYVKTLDELMGLNLGCSITHANGCNNIGKVTSLFLGLGIPHIFALVDSDEGGIKERNRLVKDGVFADKDFFTTHGPQNSGRAIEDIFNREWFLRVIFDYSDQEIAKADQLLSKEMRQKRGGAKYTWAKKLYDLVHTGAFGAEAILDQSGIDLYRTLVQAIQCDSDSELEHHDA